MKKVYRFSTIFCGPCRTYAPIFDKISSEFPDIESIHIDCGTDPETARGFGIRNVPSTVFISGDNNPKVVVGLISEQDLREYFTNL